MTNEKDFKVTPTEIIDVGSIDETEAELRELSKEELLYRLHYTEENKETIKLIKKVLKDKA